MHELGCDQISVGDTIGVAEPDDVGRVLSPLLERVPAERLALHLHDTRGRAIDNAAAGLHLGITTFDASASGLGGCPFAPGAPGNLATETLVSWLHGLGIETGVDEPALLERPPTSAPSSPKMVIGISVMSWTARTESR